MKCPKCKSKSIVRKVHLEDTLGIKLRHHTCCNCSWQFSSFQGTGSNVVKFAGKVHFNQKIRDLRKVVGSCQTGL